MGELTEQAWQAVAPLAGEKGLFFMSEISALGGVYCDRERILQVFINLFSNAIKFTPAGSITCVIKPENAQALVCVSDTGIGIDLENQEMIFEKFIQARDALTDKPKGTGLGLAICRKIIHHHGGIIWVESQPGQGSSFCFTLPLTPNHPEATQP